MTGQVRVVRGYLVAVLLLTAVATASAQNGHIGGTVKDESGRPIAGATVTATFLNADIGDWTATTDKNGHWNMIGLRYGDWMFRIAAPGYLDVATSLPVRQIGVNPSLAFALRKEPTEPTPFGGKLDERALQAELASADALYATRHWDDAIAAYRAILAKAPSLSIINLQIASAYRNKKAYDQAIRAYTALLRADPGNDKAQIGIAMTDIEMGDAGAAEKALEVAAQAAGATREVFFSLGEVRRGRAELDMAAQAYQRAAELDPSWGKPPLALGRLAMDRGDMTAAAGYFHTVLDVDPVSPEAAQATTLLQQIQK